MDLGLAGRIAVVTGGSRGMGRAIALRLASEGAQVAICARSPSELRRAADDIAAETGRRPFHQTCDLSDGDAIAAFMAMVESELGGVDILVANAGGPPRRPALALDDADWEACFVLNFMSVVRLMRSAIPSMRRRGGGRIVTITSTSVERPLQEFALSNAMRPAVVGLVRTLACEMAPFGIRINNICPGRIGTERVVAREDAVARETGRAVDELRRGMLARIPLGRYGAASEVADAVAYVVSDRATYLTGASIVIDGGLTLAGH